MCIDPSMQSLLMRRPAAILAATLMLAVSAVALHAQEAVTHVIGPRIGNSIAAAVREYFHLFPDLPCFQSATAERIADGWTRFRVTCATDDFQRILEIRISSSETRILGWMIEHYEALRESGDPAAAWRAAYPGEDASAASFARLAVLISFEGDAPSYQRSAITLRTGQMLWTGLMCQALDANPSTKGQWLPVLAIIPAGAGLGALVGAFLQHEESVSGDGTSDGIMHNLAPLQRACAFSREAPPELVDSLLAHGDTLRAAQDRFTKEGLSRSLFSLPDTAARSAFSYSVLLGLDDPTGKDGKYLGMHVGIGLGYDVEQSRRDDPHGIPEGPYRPHEFLRIRFRAGIACLVFRGCIPFRI